MAYLKKFTTVDEYNSFKRKLTKNYVSLISSTGEVKYDKGMPAGIFIQHIDGKLYTTNEWTLGGFSNDKANGVAVVTSECAFVIAKNDVSSSKNWASDTSTLIDGVITAVDGDAAKADFSGVENTALITSIDTSGAAYLCANFTFPNGKKGYLPASGELWVANNHKTEIKAALLLIGGIALLEGNSSIRYWTSTQYDARYAWAVGWASNYILNYKKTESYYVRPFTTL